MYDKVTGCWLLASVEIEAPSLIKGTIQVGRGGV